MTIGEDVLEEDEDEEEEKEVEGDWLVGTVGEGKCNCTGCAEIASSASSGVIFANSSFEGSEEEDVEGGEDEGEEDVKRELVVVSLSEAMSISAASKLRWKGTFFVGFLTFKRS